MAGVTTIYPHLAVLLVSVCSAALSASAGGRGGVSFSIGNMTVHGPVSVLGSPAVAPPSPATTSGPVFLGPEDFPPLGGTEPPESCREDGPVILCDTDGNQTGIPEEVLGGNGREADWNLPDGDFCPRMEAFIRGGVKGLNKVYRL